MPMIGHGKRSRLLGLMFMLGAVPPLAAAHLTGLESATDVQEFGTALD